MAAKNAVELFFINPDGEEFRIEAPIGLSLLEVIRKYNRENSGAHVDMEGACDGALACATCHVIIEDKDFFGSLSNPSQEEEDMLDYCYAVTKYSRLGCQIIVDANMQGQKFRLPRATRNIIGGHS